MSSALRGGLLRSNDQTVKVVTCWTRHNCQVTVPIAVLLISVKYINQIRAQFNKRNCHCVTTPDNFQTVTLICQIPEHLPSICSGILSASTEIGMYKWTLKINKFSKYIIIGIAQFKFQDAFFGLTVDKQSDWAITGWKTIKKKTKTRRFKRDIESKIEDGDQITIIIYKTVVAFEVFNDKCSKWKFKSNIEIGEYKIFATLQEITDSISIVDYKQLM